MGQSIYEVTHPCDHSEVKSILSANHTEDIRAQRSVFIRLKCTLTSKGRNVNVKAATYKVRKYHPYTYHAQFRADQY